MYHISKDKRALQSSELIYNGLLECIKKKPFDQISVSDLQKASGVARSTFYRAFDHSDILELLIQINRQDIIYACHMKNAEILQQRFGEAPGLHIQHGDYFIAIRTGFTISVLTVWLKGGRKETAEELVKIIEEQLSFLAKSTSSNY